MKVTPRISILIVNLNYLEYTKNVVGDLQQQNIPFNLTIVDQASTEEGTKEFLDKCSFLPNTNIIQNTFNQSLNQVWNDFVERCNTEFVCLLNNDIRIPPNFLSSTIEVFDLEPEVGAVNHSTNHPHYTEWSDELEYKVIDKPYRQGWDFTFRKEYYTPIPNSLTFYHGDDWIYSKLYSLGKKGAYVLSSPILHYEASTTESRGGRKLTNDYQIWHSIIKVDHKNLRFSDEYCKLKPQFNELKKKKSLKKAFIFHCNEKYLGIVGFAIKSIKQYSNLPIYVYLINSNQKINEEGVTTIKWDITLKNSNNPYLQDKGNFYIDRGNSDIYNILIQKSLIAKHALENFADVIAYIDSDSIATPYVEKIFNFYNPNSLYPYFGEGIYDWLHYNGRGGAKDRSDLSTTLEHPICELFNLNQYNRLDHRYRQTGYFIAGKNNIEFLEEWYWMCNHPTILKNTSHYAPFHEETVLNPLLWDRKFYSGLPLVYINGTLDIIDKVYNVWGFNGQAREVKPWFKIPSKKENLLFFHGEKRLEILSKMIIQIKQLYENGII